MNSTWIFCFGSVFSWKTLIQLEVMNIWKSYKLWELLGEELYDRRSSQLQTQRLQLRKESLKWIFSGFLFATAKVASITAMILFRLFHIYNYSAFYKHLVHIKPLIQVLLKTWRTEFCRELLSPSRFFVFILSLIKRHIQ